jgi:hypothetical protein
MPQQQAMGFVWRVLCLAAVSSGFGGTGAAQTAPRSSLTVTPSSPVNKYSPRPHPRCWPARPDLGKRWRSRLVATAAALRLNISPVKSRCPWGKRNVPQGPGGPLKVPGWCVSKTVGRRPRYGTGLHWKPPPYDAPRSRQFHYSSRLSKKVTVPGTL